MGGHIDRCNHKNCQRLHLSYNSSINRHCPKCQGHKGKQWIEDSVNDVFNDTYFHVVFTIPLCLNELALQYPKELYAAMFRASWLVIKGFGGNPKFLGAQTGMISILHTWGKT
jgi:hypothetical protein